MRVYFLIVVLIGVFTGNISYAQTYTFQKDYDFANHLSNNSQFDEALFVLRKFNREKLNEGQRDTVNYLLGWSFYNKKYLDSSVFYLRQVNPVSVFYHKSAFYQGFNLIYEKKYPQAGSVFNNIQNLTDTNLVKLKNFELAGMYLLQRNYSAFDSLSKGFNYDFYPLAAEQKNLLQYKDNLLMVKKKSPLAAGVFSALIPGSGKFYAGYKGQSLSTFLTVVSLAAIAGECYYRGGPKSFPFIAAGSVFTIFYVGNIWGSVLSVKNKRNEKFRDIDDDILYDLHIPLRRVFR